MLAPASDAPALVDAALGRSWTYAELHAAVAEAAERLQAPARRLVACRCGTDAASAIAYLGALAAGHAVLLLDAAADPAVTLERYDPHVVIAGGEVTQRRAAAAELHRDLALLLSTSGTTGSPKLVRLSAGAVRANAASISEYLGLGPGERAVASLPIHYSYGLSVLNSHLLAGATVVFAGESIARPAFWEAFAAHGCTSFAGVPYAYAILRRTGFERLALPTLRTMTQAGGKMAPDMIQAFHAHLRPRGARLVVMYGQTEATARISWVPPERLEEKLGSIGVPIPRGRLAVDGDELVYQGPNVMLGYAQRREDLALGDELDGTLRTGDLGLQDADGFFWLTGRSKRIVKLFGNRINLDEVEDAARGRGPVAAVGIDDLHVVVYREAGDEPAAEPLRRALARAWRVPPGAVVVRDLERLPVTGAGKIDYGALEP